MIPALLLALLAHPIHSSTAVITGDLLQGALTVTLRVFEDDFPPGRDSAAASRYLGVRFRLSDAAGRAVPLSLRTIRADAPVLVLTLSGLAPRAPATLLVWHGVLSERFPDQLNLVRSRLGGRSDLLLFTPGDGPKPLP